jgi:hypothetical protein
MKALIVGLMIFGFLGLSQAEETMGEKAKATTNSGKRAVKKGMNRTKEAFCGKLTGDSKVECLAKQAKNRVTEGADTVKDKAVEIKNEVDTDKQ